MSDNDLTISADVLRNARELNPKNSKKKIIRWVVTLGLGGIIFVLFGYAMWNVFKPLSSVQGTYYLNNTVPSKSIIDWGAGGDFKADNLNTPTGDWILNTETGQFDSVEWPGCSMYWNKLYGDTGVFQSDESDTDRYTEEFFSGKETSLGSVMFPVRNNSGEQVGEIEMKKAYFRDDGDNYALAFYRRFPANALTMFAVVRCGSEDSLSKLVPVDSLGEEISRLFDVWIQTGD